MSQLQKPAERSGPAEDVMIHYVDQLISSVSASLRSGQSSGRIEDVLANLESTDESFSSYVAVVVGVKWLYLVRGHEPTYGRWLKDKISLIDVS